MDDLRLPWFTSVWWTLCVFGLSLLVWHAVFLWLWPLSKAGWKKVDYAWVSLALLGVMGNVGANRREVALNLSELAQSRLAFAERQVRESLAFGHSPAICRQFVRSEFSPPPAEFDREQREYDAMCAWFTAAEARLPLTKFAKHEAIAIEDLGTPLPTGADQWAVRRLRETIDEYNGAVSAAHTTGTLARRSLVEELLSVFSPSLLAIAIALRLAKVTGELRLDALSPFAPRK